MERAGEAIASAGGAVIMAFLALILCSLSIFRAIGPALAIAVAVTLLAVADAGARPIVTLLGRELFWPSKKWMQEPEAAHVRRGRRLPRPAARCLRRGHRPGPRRCSPSLRSVSTRPSTSNSSLPEDAESTKALETFQEHFAAGAGRADTDHAHLRPTAARSTRPSSTAFAPDLEGADGVSRSAPAGCPRTARAAEFSIMLDHDPVSDAALADVKGPIRDAAHERRPTAPRRYVGGITSVFVDIQAAMDRDYSVVFPVAALIIMLILALLLRSLVAPIYLMASVGLGFAATLGATVLVFQHIQGEPGLIFILPIYIYLFVVALGTDYNILMIARLREEAREGKDPHAAAAEAVQHAGPTIAAAGVILAGTFASLMLGGNSCSCRWASRSRSASSIAAFVMAMFFTPALTALIGHAAWWPGHGDEKREPAADSEEEFAAELR